MFIEPTILILLWYVIVTSQWVRWRFISPASPLFTQPFIQAQIKENIKAPRHWPLGGEFIGGQRASDTENVSIWWRHHVITDKVTYKFVNQVYAHIENGLYENDADQYKCNQAITQRVVFRDIMSAEDES